MVFGEPGISLAPTVSYRQHVVLRHRHSTDPYVSAQKAFSRLIRFFVCVLYVYAAQVTEIFWTGLVAGFSRGFGIYVDHVLSALWVGLQIDVRVASLGGPDQGLRATETWYPHRWVRFLQWRFERVNYTEVVVLTFPTERARGSPGFDDQVMGLFEPLPVVEGIYVSGETFYSSTPNETRDHSPIGDHVDLGNLFGHSQWIFEGGQRITHQHDFGFGGISG